MIRESLAEALGLLRDHPVLWVPGIVAGACTSGGLLLESMYGTFFAGKLAFLFLFVILFFVAAALGAIQAGEYSGAGFLKQGAARYFRVLVPSLVISFTVIVLLLLIVTTLAAIGLTGQIALIALVAVFLVTVILFLTFFYDTAAVFEGKRTFESIRRSIELVSRAPGQVLGFYLVSLVILFGITFVALIAWTGLLFDKLEPFATMNMTEASAMTPESFVSLLGADGILITAVVYFLIVFISSSILLSYKACFYRKLASLAPAVEQVTGEFDSKGRWYKY
ncbi:MAG: hypothetical protein ABFC24_08360 [Methanoregulaceae archaeon]